MKNMKVITAYHCWVFLVRYCANHFTYINSLHSQNNPVIWYYFPHFIHSKLRPKRVMQISWGSRGPGCLTWDLALGLSDTHPPPTTAFTPGKRTHLLSPWHPWGSYPLWLKNWESQSHSFAREGEGRQEHEGWRCSILAWRFVFVCFHFGF